MAGAITINIPGDPVAKGRPIFRRLPKGMVIAATPAKTKRYEQRVRSAALRAMDGIPPLSGPISLRLMVNVPMPSSWPKKKAAKASAHVVLPTKRPDADNLAKSVIDGMNGVVFADDSQVTDLIVTKRYSSVPGVVVTVALIEGREAA